MAPLFNDLLARVAHGVSRRVIELDDRAQDLLTPLSGRVIEVHVTPLELTFFVIAENASIVILDRFDGAVDARVSARPSQFFHVLRAGGTASAVRASGMQIDGDLDVVEAFAQAAQSLDPDIEDYLSRFVGDGPARKLGLSARRLRDWFDSTSRHITEDAGYYLREDSGVLITPEALTTFANDVDTLRADTDRLEQRIARLMQGKDA